MHSENHSLRQSCMHSLVPLLTSVGAYGCGTCITANALLSWSAAITLDPFKSDTCIH